MTVEELRLKCENALTNPIAAGSVSLLIPGRAYGATKRFPKTNIKGEIVCEYDDCCLCAFDAKKILDMLDKENGGG